MFCPVCEGEFREGFTRCNTCDVDLVEALPSKEEPQPSAAMETDAAEERAPEPLAEKGSLAERGLRARELLLVLLVCFGRYVVSSLHYVLTRIRGSSLDLSAYGSLKYSVTAVGSLALLAYVLSRRGRSLRQLGLTAERSDLPHTLLLTAAAFLPSILLCFLRGWPLDLLSIFHPAAALAGAFRLGALCWIGLLLSAAEEELVVRAYMITEVLDLTGGVALAVLASTCFQGLYHLYQGGPSALRDAAAFLIYSIYYIRHRRATPLVLSHFLYNLLIFGYYQSWQAGGAPGG